MNIEELRRLPWCLNTSNGNDVVAVSPKQWRELLDEIERLQAALDGAYKSTEQLGKESRARIEKLQGALRELWDLADAGISNGDKAGAALWRHALELVSQKARKALGEK